MKAKLSVLGNSGEIEISKEDLEGIEQFFSDATPGFIKHSVGIWNDNKKTKRTQNLIKIVSETIELAKKYNLKTQSLSLKISVPFMEAASLEEDETMQKMWTNLLANTTGGKVIGRTLYVSILKELTADDAKVLNLFCTFIKEKKLLHPSQYVLSKYYIFKDSKENNIEAEIVIENLIRQGLIKKPEKRTTRLPFQFGSINVLTSTATYNGGDKNTQQIVDYLKEDRDNSEKAENNFQLTSIGYSLLKACNEPENLIDESAIKETKPK